MNCVYIFKKIDFYCDDVMWEKLNLVLNDVLSASISSDVDHHRIEKSDKNSIGCPSLLKLIIIEKTPTKRNK